MSGLLHRLAAQATGRAGPSVHALARMPYVAPLELVEEAQAPKAPPSRSEQSRTASTNSLKPAWPAFDPRPPPPASDSATVSSVPPPLMPSLSPKEPKRPTTEPAMTTGIPTDDSPGPSPDADVQPEDHGLVVTIPPSAPMTPEAQPEQGLEPDPSIPQLTEQPSAPMPAPLLAQVRPAPYKHGAAGPYSPVQPLDTRHKGEPDSTEVHVHIGRIEVTAVHEAPPAKPKRPPVREPMSLDEYLTRRKEEHR